MARYLCGCRLEGKTFTFCSIHLLSPKKRRVENLWMQKYTPEKWIEFTQDLVSALDLVAIEVVVESHPCEAINCTNLVLFDDEPLCYTHSPGGGSFLMGYSYKKTRK